MSHIRGIHETDKKGLSISSDKDKSTVFRMENDSDIQFEMISKNQECIIRSKRLILDADVYINNAADPFLPTYLSIDHHGKLVSKLDVGYIVVGLCVAYSLSTFFF